MSKKDIPWQVQDFKVVYKGKGYDLSWSPNPTDNKVIQYEVIREIKGNGGLFRIILGSNWDRVYLTKVDSSVCQTTDIPQIRGEKMRYGIRAINEVGYGPWNFVKAPEY